MLSFPAKLGLIVAARGFLKSLKAHRTHLATPASSRRLGEATDVDLAAEVVRFVRTAEASGVKWTNRAELREVVAELLDEFAPLDGERMVSVSREQLERLIEVRRG